MKIGLIEIMTFMENNYMNWPVLTCNHTKDGELIDILQRHQIEGQSAGQIADTLVGFYEANCNKKNSDEEIASMRSRFIERFRMDPLGA